MLVSIVKGSEIFQRTKISIYTLNNPFCSKDIDKRVQDSSKVCSGIIPSDVDVTVCVGNPLSIRAGVDWHSSCWFSAVKILIYYIK